MESLQVKLIIYFLHFYLMNAKFKKKHDLHLSKMKKSCLKGCCFYFLLLLQVPEPDETANHSQDKVTGQIYTSLPGDLNI